MNFTREPIIETIITPKEGYKLIIKSSKVSGGEDFVVDAIELVSFGQSLFYRSMERPKPFIVPVSDYEIVETKETRVVLKSASFERSIKIGGGREASLKVSKEKGASEAKTDLPEAAAVEQRLEKKREKRRHRRRRSGSPGEEGENEVKPDTEKSVEGGEKEDETVVSSSTVSRLIPPPPGLISDNFSKPRPEEVEVAPEEAVSSEPVSEEKAAEPKAKAPRRRKKSAPSEPKEEVSIEEPSSPSVEEEPPPVAETPPPEVEGGEVNRLATPVAEEVTTTSFSSSEGRESSSWFGKIW